MKTTSNKGIWAFAADRAKAAKKAEKMGDMEGAEQLRALTVEQVHLMRGGR